MINYFAVVTEVGTLKDKIIGNTKNGKYKGMNKDEFKDAIKKDNCFSFEVKEMKADYSTHREYLNDKW